MAKVYLIYNTINNKKYVGTTLNCVSQRFCQHIDSAFRTSEKRRNSFYKEIHSCKEEVFNIFKYTILEECEDEVRFKREKYYIKKIKPAYNEAFKWGYIINEKDKIIDLYLKGKTIDEIRIIYKCRQNIISDLLKENGIKIQKSRNKFSKPVYLFNKDGVFIKEWQDASTCSSELNIDRGNIRICCLNNTKENMLYYSAGGKNFKYNKDVPKNMFKVSNKITEDIIYFKTKEALVCFFKEMFPKARYGAIIREGRKYYHGYVVKKLYGHRN